MLHNCPALRLLAEDDLSFGDEEQDLGISMGLHYAGRIKSSENASGSYATSKQACRRNWRAGGL